jgi:hypothetical protein
MNLNVAVVLFAVLPSVVCTAAEEDVLAFRPGNAGEYIFDTGVLRGVLRPNGQSRGLSSVVHVPTGARLDRSMGIAAHYRVFTAGKRYGAAAWDWEGTAERLPDGSVQTTWPATSGRPFEMRAVYRWADPQTLDVETTFTALDGLRSFEAFLASYFDEAFSSPYVYAQRSPEGEYGPGFLLARKSYGDWLMFPRDKAVLPIIQDGRWTLEPHPVDWRIMPTLAAPVCLRRGADDHPTVVLMAPPEDCFAIATPYEGEGHYSLYLSLLGRNIKAGATAMARARFIVATHVSDEEVANLFRQYIEDLQSPKK